MTGVFPLRFGATIFSTSIDIIRFRLSGQFGAREAIQHLRCAVRGNLEKFQIHLIKFWVELTPPNTDISNCVGVMLMTSGTYSETFHPGSSEAVDWAKIPKFFQLYDILHCMGNGTFHRVPKLW